MRAEEERRVAEAKREVAEAEAAARRAKASEAREAAPVLKAKIENLIHEYQTTHMNLTTGATVAVNGFYNAQTDTWAHDLAGMVEQRDRFSRMCVKCASLVTELNQLGCDQHDWIVSSTTEHHLRMMFVRWQDGQRWSVTGTGF